MKLAKQVVLQPDCNVVHTPAQVGIRDSAHMNQELCYTVLRHRHVLANKCMTTNLHTSH